MRHSDMDAVLAGLYARVPEIPGCLGRCWTSCGPIDMGGRERQRILRRGIRITPRDQALALTEDYWCEALDGSGRCAAYAVRPMICRLWGAVEGLPCPYGCKPVPGYLTDEEAYRLLTAASNVGDTARYQDLTRRRLSPAELDMLERFYARGRQSELNRAVGYDALPPEITRRKIRVPRQEGQPSR